VKSTEDTASPMTKGGILFKGRNLLKTLGIYLTKRDTGSMGENEKMNDDLQRTRLCLETQQSSMNVAGYIRKLPS